MPRKGRAVTVGPGTRIYSLAYGEIPEVPKPWRSFNGLFQPLKEVLTPFCVMLILMFGILTALDMAIGLERWGLETDSTQILALLILSILGAALFIADRTVRHNYWALDLPLNRELFCKLNTEIESMLRGRMLTYKRDAIPVSHLNKRFKGEWTVFSIENPGGKAFTIDTKSTITNTRATVMRPWLRITDISPNNLETAVSLFNELNEMLVRIKYSEYPDLSRSRKR